MANTPHPPKASRLVSSFWQALPCHAVISPPSWSTRQGCRRRRARALRFYLIFSPGK